MSPDNQLNKQKQRSDVHPNNFLLQNTFTSLPHASFLECTTWPCPLDIVPGHDHDIDNYHDIEIGAQAVLPSTHADKTAYLAGSRSGFEQILSSSILGF